MQLICGLVSLISLMLAFIGACLYAYLVDYAEKRNGFGPNKETVVAISIAFLLAILVNIFIIYLAYFLEIG